MALKNCQFLAQLSRSLTRWAYSIPMVCHPSVCPSSTLSNLNISEASWPILIKFLLSITGVGESCIRCWGRLDQNSGFHGNRKPPLTYNGENDVSTFFGCFYTILFILAGNEDMHKISNEFEFRSDWPTDYGVSYPWASKKFPMHL